MAGAEHRRLARYRQTALQTLSTEVTPSWQPTNAAEESAACVSGG